MTCYPCSTGRCEDCQQPGRGCPCCPEPTQQWVADLDENDE